LNGVSVGGITCIKTSSALAYVGFATEGLASDACARLGMHTQVQIVEFSSLAPETRDVGHPPKVIVRIPDALVLETYFNDPAAFPSENYFVSAEDASNAA
jgi:hypothetical protein